MTVCNNAEHYATCFHSYKPSLFDSKQFNKNEEADGALSKLHLSNAVVISTMLLTLYTYNQNGIELNKIVTSTHTLLIM